MNIFGKTLVPLFLVAVMMASCGSGQSTRVSTFLEIFYNVAVSILFLLTALVALWVSGRIIRRNLVGVNRSTRLFLWLVLGGFFRIPLIDLLSALGTLIAQTIPFTSDLSELSIRPDIT